VATRTPDSITKLRRFFSEPSSPRQRQYEALRAYFFEQSPSADVAKRFGYSAGAFRVLCHTFRRGDARLLELQSDEVYFPHIIRLMGLQDRPDDPIAAAARDGASAFYARMEKQLDGLDYLVGPYSYADIAFFMAQLFGDRMGAPIGHEHAGLIKWRARMTARQAVRQVIEPMVRYLIRQGRRVPSWLSV
jgi:glutathione S-transferase